MGFFRGNGSSPSRNRSINLLSIDVGKRVNKLGGKARKILENGSPPLTISEAILLFTCGGARRSTSGTGKSGHLGKEGTTSSEIGKEGTKSSEMGKEGMKSSGMGKEGA